MEDNHQECQREKPRKKRRGKLWFLLILILLVAAALYLGHGLGLGQGTGNAGGGPSGPPSASDSAAPSENPTPTQSQEPQESAGQERADITVEVTRSEYLVDGKEATLEEIEGIIQGLDGGTVTVRDNYGSAKAHDELTALLARYGISAVME